MKRRPGLILLPVLGVTIASFVLSTWIGQERAAGIGRAAESIATNAVPTVDLMSDMRTKLRHLEVTLDDYTDRVALGAAGDDRSLEALEELTEIERDWNRYIDLNLIYPGERELHPTAQSALADVKQVTHQLLTLLANRQGPAAEGLLTARVKPSIDRADGALIEISRVNSKSAVALSTQIVEMRRTSKDLAILLDIISAGLSLIVGFLAILIVRRFSQVQEGRISDLSDFAGRVAHDIRSPLASVSMALEIAQRDASLNTKPRDMLARGTRTLQRVGQLVDGLLVFALAGAPPSEGKVSSVGEVVDGVVEDFLPLSQEKGIEMETDTDESPTVSCSPGVLTSIVGNLVGNAIKYMGDAPTRRVSIHVRDLGKLARIEVADTGPGVPPDLQAHLFNPYVRSAQAGVPGMGLGLATVRRLVEAHGGSVKLSSHPGDGSVFTVDLPTV